MERKTVAMHIKPGMKDEFKGRFRQIWPELISILEKHGVKNLSVWCVEDLAFGYCEVNGNVSNISGNALATDEEISPAARWFKYMEDCCEFISSPYKEPMRLMYQDIGIIREDKSKIRHRVFVTRLKPGCTEEYKRRHDELIASRGGKINPGPESNFTIWNAGDYIFGYCELDKSMEHEPTEEEKQAIIEWETKMLEIMDWITDDVDWLTGLKHDKIELVFQYN